MVTHAHGEGQNRKRGRYLTVNGKRVIILVEMPALQGGRVQVPFVFCSN